MNDALHTHADIPDGNVSTTGNAANPNDAEAPARPVVAGQPGAAKLTSFTSASFTPAGTTSTGRDRPPGSV